VFLSILCLVVKYLEAERQAHNNLKQTWQMANDQFLQAQRLMMNDMRSMESVLTAEQQRQIEGTIIQIGYILY